MSLCVLLCVHGNSRADFRLLRWLIENTSPGLLDSLRKVAVKERNFTHNAVRMSVSVPRDDCKQGVALQCSSVCQKYYTAVSSIFDLFSAGSGMEVQPHAPTSLNLQLEVSLTVESLTGERKRNRK